MSLRLLQLALRNLWRNPQRTFFTMSAIAFGYVMLLFVACLMAGLRWQMIENGTCLVMSQIQVHAPGSTPAVPFRRPWAGGKGQMSALCWLRSPRIAEFMLRRPESTDTAC